MQRPLDYVIVSGRSPGELTAKVTALLSEGWTVFSAPFAQPTMLYQALMKWEEEQHDDHPVD